ncbi:hypothetical protein GCM10010339_67880 [Streptomyces alanosinicus]|uniref:Uncharacterized protein n=1 Tax=Streptomyces alanosinicus TaxID=68171 RepID=A0A918YPZ2_9ACTN|nr:hypothetical protein GCM10010339_67880 [Streptomyces alanosinicus]
MDTGEDADADADVTDMADMAEAPSSSAGSVWHPPCTTPLTIALTSTNARSGPIVSGGTYRRWHD